MSGQASAWLLLIAPAVPLLLCALALSRRTRALLPAALIAAPLPSLAAALWLPDGAVLELPWMLLGTRLGLDAVARPFLLLFAALWLVAGWHAFHYLRDDARRAEFSVWMLASMAGNLGAAVALDPVAFYVAFSLMSLAAYGLVVHSRTPAAMHAGRVTLAFVIASELAFFAGLSAGVAPPGAAAFVLLGIGLAIKAGLFPLHGWLPLAHPAAPVPASAVLSGAMIAVGVLGALRYLAVPPMAGAGPVVVALGAAGSLAGVLLGVRRADPKAVLAWSSVSQMGLAAVGTGLVMMQPDPAARGAAVAATALFAVHHGLAKACLFLATASAPGSARGVGRWLRRAALLLPALALAGAPVGSGVVAKAALKDIVDGPAWVDLFLTASSVATTVLLLRFGQLMWRREGAEEPGTLAPLAAALALSVAGFAFWPGVGEANLVSLSPASLWSGLWPVLLGAGLGWLLARRLPPAREDAPVRQAEAPGFEPARWLQWQVPAPGGWLRERGERVGARLQALETGAGVWRCGAAASLLVGALLLWAAR